MMDRSDTAEIVVVRHLSDIESALRFLEEKLEPEFDKAVGSRMEEWAAVKGWAGGFDPESSNYFWMASPTWRATDGGEDDFSFRFSLRPLSNAGEDDDKSSISSYIGASASGNRRGLELERNVAPKKRVWQGLLGSMPELLQQLRDLGFETDTRAGVISCPVELDVASLGQAFADNDFSEVLAPLESALNKVSQATPLFDKLLAAARAAR